MPDFLWDCFAVLGVVTASACMLSGLSLAAILYAQFRQDRLNQENAKRIVVKQSIEIKHPPRHRQDMDWNWPK